MTTAFMRQGEGPPLLLLHGAEASHDMFADLVPLLAPHFTVIAYDQRDCGASEGADVPATLTDLAADACALLSALGYSSVHVFGTSFGGRLAQVLALEHPAIVRRLALASTWALATPYIDVNPRGAEIRELRARLPDSARALAAWFFPPSALEARPALLEVFSQARPATERSRRRAQTVASPVSGDISRISAPTLLLAGDADRVVPLEATRAMAKLLPRARFQLLRDVGHVAAMQAPGLLAASLIDFFLAEPGKGS
ncbi:MAG: alpha/beta hydrolase [Gammaproteobacteria bacterium]|nr:alpha/beta hydrolase [Gammaproteobacteria bacterium]